MPFTENNKVGSDGEGVGRALQACTHHPAGGQCWGGGGGAGGREAVCMPCRHTPTHHADEEGGQGMPCLAWQPRSPPCLFGCPLSIQKV